MNFSASKAGKQEVEWLIKVFFSAMSKHTAFPRWWASLDDNAKKTVLDDIHDELRWKL